MERADIVPMAWSTAQCTFTGIERALEGFDNLADGDRLGWPSERVASSRSRSRRDQLRTLEVLKDDV
jgi:hypothetical protein